jgi:menaquinone-specific isochorismate synthase
MTYHTDNLYIKTDNNVHTVKEAKAAIARWLTSHDFPDRLQRIEIEIVEQDILKWLASQNDKTRLYFSGRDAEDIEAAGVGTADSIFCAETPDYKETFEYIRNHLNPMFPGLRYYGGFSFAPGHIDDDWKNFGACRFFIPRFELLRKQNRTFFACSAVPDDNNPEKQKELLSQLDALDFSCSREFSKPGELLSRTDSPSFDEWKKNLTEVIAQIKDGQYTKAVLARKVDLHFDRPLDAVSILASLKRLPANRYNFLFQFDGKRAFVGSSPERLYKRSGRSILSEAVAGTRSRGNEEKEDLFRANELINSDKDQREHDFVIRTVEKELLPFCTSMETDKEKSLMKLREGIHLVSYLRGTLKPTVTDEMIVIALHPTPAVGGCPTGKALEVIRESEPFKRGWYAGIIGTVGQDSADFAVGLRSGLVNGERLSLFSGVGIVDGSNPDDEWEEMDQKTLNFMDIVTTNGK